MMLSLLTSVLLVLILIILSYAYLIRNYGYWKRRGVPYIKPKFFFGSILEVALGRAHPGLYIGSHYDQFNSPYFGFFAFTRPYLVITDPELIKTVLIKDFNYFSNRYFVCDEKIDPVFSNSLFASKNPTWRWLRTKLSPYLSYSKIKTMLLDTKECSKHLNSYINNTLGKTVDVKEMAVKYTNDAIVSCSFGISTSSFANDNEFHLAGQKMLSQSFGRRLSVFSYYYAPSLVKLFRLKFIDTAAVDCMRNIFLNVSSTREECKMKPKRSDLIDVLIHLKNQNFKDFEFNDDSMVAQAVTLFAAGFEATASALAFALHEVCVNPDVQVKLRKEIKTQTAKCENISYLEVQNMTYLDMVTSETMRKYPATSFIHRECVKDYKVKNTGLLIKKGTPVIVGQYGVHYNPKYFPNPEKFDPERFNDRNVSNIIKGTYLPFGDGPRSCVGQALGLLIVKMGIIEILKHFSIERSLSTVEPITLTPFPIIQAKGGIPLCFKRLN